MGSARFGGLVLRKCTLKNVMYYIFGGPKPNFWAVTPSSENQKDAQRSCDQFPGSIASRWLF